MDVLGTHVKLRCFVVIKKKVMVTDYCCFTTTIAYCFVIVYHSGYIYSAAGQIKKQSNLTL